MPKLGDPVRLNLQLFDGATDKFVRAWVLDDSGALLPGTPVALSHQGYGLYANKSIAMPSTPQLKAVYRVYLDADFAEPSPIHSDAIDVFDLEIATQLATEIVGYIDGDIVLQGYVEMNDIVGQVFLDVPLNGIVEVDGSLSGMIDITTTLIGQIIEDDVVGEIECCKC